MLMICDKLNIEEGLNLTEERAFKSPKRYPRVGWRYQAVKGIPRKRRRKPNNRAVKVFFRKG
jgi:hypothetical protein